MRKISLNNEEQSSLEDSLKTANSQVLIQPAILLASNLPYASELNFIEIFMEKNERCNDSL